MEMTVMYVGKENLHGETYIHTFKVAGPSFTKIFVEGEGNCLRDDNGVEVVEGDIFTFKGEPLEVYKATMFSPEMYRVSPEGFERA